MSISHSSHFASGTPLTDQALRREVMVLAKRFETFSAPETPESEVALTPRNIEAHLRLETHRIEKGMSIAAPRRPYGQLAQERIEHLLDLAAGQRAKHAGLISAEEQALEAVLALEAWNDQPGGRGSELRDPEIVRPYRDLIPRTFSQEGRGHNGNSAVVDVHGPTTTPTEIEDTRPLMDEFFLRRSSVRSFDPHHPVSPESLEKAVRIALNSPSVCNRATGRVHFYQGSEKIAPLLALQQGNRGLSGIRQLAIVTVELGLFAGIKEFAQPWIDGGLFLMNLVWGFHIQDIGSCLLNWCMPEDTSRELRAVADIPESELVISMMAFGYPQRGTYLTRSAKPPMPHVMTMH